MWHLKFVIAIIVDFLDFTVGRVLFMTPLAGEAVGVAVGCAMFGTKGLWYLVEAIDFTEQVDGFIPTCTLIALASKD